jgi:hypothetical protein
MIVCRMVRFIERVLVMVKRIMMTLLLSGFLIVGVTSAMEPLESPKKTTPPKDENAKKMLLLKEHMKNMDAEQADVHGHTGKILHAVTHNPVLDGILKYKNPQTNAIDSIKIGPNVKDGMIDLSAFGGRAKFLFITTDPKVFFDNHEKMLVILIAPRSLIFDNLSSPSCTPFQPIMKDWDEKIAPIGIFWRTGGESDKSQYDYQIKLPLDAINQKSLYDLWPKLPSSTLKQVGRAEMISRGFMLNFDLK